VNGREAARSCEWAQHFSNASCWMVAVRGSGNKRRQHSAEQSASFVRGLDDDQFGFGTRCTAADEDTVRLHQVEFRYRPRSRGDNTFGSVRPSVCLCALSCLNRLTFDLDFWHEGRPWPWLA